MTTAYRNNVQLPASGTAPSTSNCGGPAGDQPEAVTLTGTSSFTADNTVIFHGRQSWAISTTPAGATAFVTKNLIAASATAACMVYIKTPSNVASVGAKCGAFYTGTSTPACFVGWSAAGKLIIGNNVATAVGTSGTVVLTASTWYRFELQVTVFSATVGAATAQVFLGDSATTVDTASVTSGAGANFGGTTADRARFGTTTAPSSAVSYSMGAYACTDGATALGAGWLPYTAWKCTSSGVFIPAGLTVL